MAGFFETGTGEFAFDTGTLKGMLRRDGKSVGLEPVTYIPSGMQFAAGEGIFNHYRVFTTGHRYGYGARRWPSVARLTGDGAVTVVWEPSGDRPFELRGRYHWSAPNAIDLVTSVAATADLSVFEVFLASYYPPAFSDSRVLATGENGADALLPALEADGTWHAFARDDAAWRVITDGRWTLEPSPLDWSRRPDYARPVAIRRDPATGLTLVTLGERTECFGVFTPYGKEAHYSNYLSLFGRDLAAGETAETRTRLVVLEDPSYEEVLAQADVFEKS